MMLASGTWSVRTLLMGRTISELGAMPMVHIMEAPMQTCIGIRKNPRRERLLGILAEANAKVTAGARESGEQQMNCFA